MQDFADLTAQVFDAIDNYRAKIGDKFLLAVSGGGDSLAMAKLFAEYRQKFGKITLCAAIIDHGIAENSAQVAKNAKERLIALEIDAEILRVNGKILPPLQENARKARFDLLTEYAKEMGANAIILGHNKDDLIETIIFRLMRQTGLFGLAVMDEISCSAAFARPAIFARPLLNASRNELRQYLISQNLHYFDDPANENSNFSRVNIRKQLLHLELDTQKLIGVAQKAQSLKKYYDDITAKILKSVRFGDEIIVESGEIIGQGEEIGKYALGKFIAALTNSNHPIAQEKIARIWDELKAGKYMRTNLSHLLITHRKGILKISSEPPRNGETTFTLPIEKQFKLQLAAQLNDLEIFNAMNRVQNSQ